MKTAGRILNFAMSIPVTLVSAAFVFLEGRLVLSGDWLIHEQPGLGLSQYVLRFGFAGLGLAVGLRVLAGGGKRYSIGGSLALTGMMAGIAPFAVNSVGVYLLALASAFLLTNFAVWKTDRSVEKLD